MMKSRFFLPFAVLPLWLATVTTVQANALEDMVVSLENCKSINLKECPALTELHQNPADAIPLLVSNLQHREAKKRIAAAQSLRFFEEDEALSQLLMAYANERQKKVIHAMNESLEQVPRTRVLESTLSLFQSKDVGRRTLGVILIGKRHLREHAPHLTTAANDTSRRVQHAAIRAMGEVGIPAMDVPLIQIAGDTKALWTLRQQALVSLGRIKSESVIPIALVLTGHPEVQLRKAAVAVLGEVGATYGISALVAALKDPLTSGAASISLGMLKQKQAAPAAMTALSSDKLPVPDRAQVLWGIGMMKNPSVLPALFEKLEKAPMEEAIPIVSTIGHIGSHDALPKLIPQLSHANASVREMTQWALETITGQRLGAKAGPWWKWLKSQPPPNPKKP